MSHVFISYKREDRPFAENLIERLEQAGIDCWYDRETETGERWRLVIDEAIEASFALIVLISDASFESIYVVYEWAYAAGLGLKIIPVRIQGSAIHPKLKDIQYLDFRETAYQPWNTLVADVRNAKSRHEIPEDVFERLQAPDPDVRNKTVAKIARVRDDNQLPRLVEILNYSIKGRVQRKEARKAAITAMGNIGEPARDALLEALRSRDNDVRFDAAGELAKMSGQPVVDGLIAALDERTAVQFSAIWVLGQVGGEAVIETLAAFLDDTTRSPAGKRLCDEAARALEMIRSKRSLRLALEFWKSQRDVTDMHWRHTSMTIGEYAETRIEEIETLLNDMS